MGKLTALSVKAATQPGRYQDGDGLMLVVKPSGSRAWMVRAQVNGVRRDFGLGSAKDVTLAEARSKAAGIRKLYQSGVDPVAARRAALAALNGIPTFAAAAEIVHEEHTKGWRNAKHEAQWISSLKAYAFPAIGDFRVDEIDAAMIRDMLIPIWLEKPETARRVRQRVGTVLDWAHAKGYRNSDAPMRAVSKGLPRQPKRDSHFAAMPYSEIPDFIKGLPEEPSAGRLALLFAILTAARSGEVRGATWEEMDTEAATWTVPAERMKARREHIVPLSCAALDLLSDASTLRTGRKGEPVFPGIRGKPLSDMTLTKALRDAGVAKATVHGFRSSFRDWAAEMTATPGDVVEAALAHTISNRVEAAYRRTNYLDKRRKLMDAWAAFLMDCGSSVISIAGRRRP
ncbi:tyrosine-type recombinase/integrase [Hyphomonas oceanitis]|uniref:Transposase n=1 Tax=Hyphomonas oceanitis SCH89 TaxID=1280953 RepID=A0A059G275_9PROT|nr:integrase arm-type DNA-binding domain-containing protein [Hyphomonas oceanitis]KDA00947.1 transposase [Hyphomonas oceanitis SCH89]